MRVSRFGPETGADEIRALTAERPREVERQVRAILDEVREEGDRAVRSLTAQFDLAEMAPDQMRVPTPELEAALASLEPGLLAGLRKAIANVRSVAEVQVGDPVVAELPEGHRVEIVERPVERVGAYVPGGRAAYPSTLVMCAVTARAAGVAGLAICAPPGPGGRPHPVVLATCALCGVSEVYAIGGAQAIAALAYGTESVPPVDVIVGPGNRYVQEAKRQVVGVVGIDGIAGPTELVVVASVGADPDLVALDLLAQAEHGADTLLVLVSEDAGLLSAAEEGIRARIPERPSVADAALALVQARDPEAAAALADRIAPEHVQLVGEAAETLAPSIRRAGCLFVGRDGGAAFGDYVAGSNHVLPTGGAARFQSALSVATFRRRMARVSLPLGAAAVLAPAGAAVARAEGFPVHGESMARRA